MYLESRTLNAFDDDEFLDLKNMDVVVGIMQLCCMCACSVIIIYSLRDAILDFFYFRSHLTIHKIAPLNPWTFKIWVEPLKLCSYLAYNLSCWFVKVLKETCICGHHLGFLSDNIDAIMVLFCSPTISRGSHQSILVSSMGFWDNSQTIGLVVILPLPLGPSFDHGKVNLFKKIPHANTKENKR